MEKLVKIQSELKAPKGQLNKFGGYKYRNCEDILEAVKPLLAKYNCTLKLSDKIQLIGDRFYVMATAIIKDEDNNTFEEVTAYAREEETKKGMDASQITGAASSYARKYALNGLFCIDDTKDVDADEYTAKQLGVEGRKNKKPKNYDSMTYREKVITAATERGISFTELAKDYQLDANTTEARFKEVLEDLEGKNNA